MSAITARIHVAADRTISGVAPEGLSPGEHVVVVQPGGLRRQEPTLPFDVDALPTMDLGPWPDGLSLRREDIYDDDGR